MSIEIYALSALAGLGFLFSQRKIIGQTPTNVSTDPDIEFRLVPAAEIPSVNTVYDSEHFRASQETEQRAASASFSKSEKPIETGVISRSYRDINKKPKRKVRSELSGVELDEDDAFRHNNMTPFFGSRIKQNLKDGANRTRMEHFTGDNNDVYRTKREIAPMFKSTGHIENVYGNTVAIDQHLDRFATSRIRNNERPFKPVYVAPGVAQEGFGSRGVGGFQQYYDNQEVLRPKTVDDLRVGNRKKDTYEGRILPGQGIGQRGFAGTVSQHRQKVIEERSPLRYFVTAAGHEASARRPDHIEARATERMTSSVPYMGDAVGGVKAAASQPKFKIPDKDPLDDFGFRNAGARDQGKGDDDDFGRDGIDLPAQERDLTTEKTYQGNLTSLVKAIVAPLEDVIRIGRKAMTTENGRPYGQLQPQMPAMVTVKDPNDVARTTIKETMIHDTHEANITGPIKLTVYDPEDIARKTIRETVDQVNHPNVSGQRRSALRDPDERMRTSTKETTLSGDHFGGVEASTQGAAGAYMYVDVEAKQTAKEFMSDNDYYGSALSSDKHPMSYEEFYNAETNELREGTLRGRAPVYEGSKENINMDDLRVTTRKIAADDEAPRDFFNANKLPRVVSLDADQAFHFTKSKSTLCGDDRLDPRVLEGLETNPYAMKSIACIAGQS